jgi:hypothetical protein
METNTAVIWVEDEIEILEPKIAPSGQWAGSDD